MRVFSPWFCYRWAGKIINIHPALLPSFSGLDAQKQAVDYGSKYSGCTVHFVDSGVDTGPIILQKIVKILDKDTEKTLAKRILSQEHQAYPEAVRLFAENKILRIKILAMIGITTCALMPNLLLLHQMNS